MCPPRSPFPLPPFPSFHPAPAASFTLRPCSLSPPLSRSNPVPVSIPVLFYGRTRTYLSTCPRYMYLYTPTSRRLISVADTFNPALCSSPVQFYTISWLLSLQCLLSSLPFLFHASFSSLLSFILSPYDLDLSLRYFIYYTFTYGINLSLRKSVHQNFNQLVVQKFSNFLNYVLLR